MDNILSALQIDKLPRSPGVYLMKNEKGEVLYIGKATNLRSRVSCYFSKEDVSRYQVRFLMPKVAQIETILTDNPKEALLLENTLIKKYHPRYNIHLKDDKSYVSLKLSVKDKFPRLYVTRRLKKDGSRYYGPYTSAWSCREVVDFIETHFRLRTCSDHDFRNRVRPCLQYQIHRCDAPCVGNISQESYSQVVEQVRLFLERKNDELKKVARQQMKDAAAKEAYEEAARFRDLIEEIDRTLEKQKVVSYQHRSQDIFGIYREGDRVVFYLMMVREGSLQDNRSFFFSLHEEEEESLTSLLLQYYDEEKYIPAEIILPISIDEPKVLEEIFSERSGKRVEIIFPQRGDRVGLVKLANQNAAQAFQNHEKKEKEVEEILTDIQKEFRLKNLPIRMECYDISNFQGEDSVGSMVTFLNGKPRREGYRHFKIKSVAGADDFKSMYEVLLRRLSRAKQEDEGWELPDLIVIDGGKGQLSAASRAFQELGIEGVDVISLAKSKLLAPTLFRKDPERERSQERVFILHRKDPIILSANAPALLVLMRIRDEAHRFGIEFHRKSSQRRSFESAIEQIEGIGKIRARKLLKHFGSVQGIKQASLDEISKTIGISGNLAQRLQENL